MPSTQFIGERALNPRYRGAHSIRFIGGALNPGSRVEWPPSFLGLYSLTKYGLIVFPPVPIPMKGEAVAHSRGGQGCKTTYEHGIIPTRVSPLFLFFLFKITPHKLPTHVQEKNVRQLKENGVILMSFKGFPLHTLSLGMFIKGFPPTPILLLCSYI